MKIENKTIKKYSPKSFEGAIGVFFKKNFPNLSSDVVLPHIVKAISDLTDKYLPGTENLKPGQAFVIGVHKNEKPGCRKTLFDTKMATGIIDIHTDKDLEMKRKGIKAKEIKKIKTERIIMQAIKQDIVFSHNDIGAYLNLSAGTVSKYIKEIEEDKKILLPTRGVIHDLGPKVTHKVWIIKKHILEKKTIRQVVAETHHVEQSVNRYINDFKRIKLLYDKSKINSLSVEEISKSTGLSLRLVKEYINIIQQYLEVKK